MGKILLVSIALLFISFFTMFQFIELTASNPVGMSGRKPAYAIISIENPLYPSELSFIVKTNSFWQTGSNYSDSHCLIMLDSNTYEFKELSLAGQNTITDDYAYDPYTEYTLKGTTPTANFTSLESGTHNVEVKYGYYQQLAFPNRHMEFVALGSATSEIILNQDIPQTPTPSPPNFGPTSPPTPSPTQLPIINTGAEPPQTEPFPTAQAVFVAVIVIVAGMILLGYFSKRIQRNNAL
jgi:hypothetical protein